MSYPGYDVVIPACPESFFQKDSRQAGVTEKDRLDVYNTGLNNSLKRQ